MEVFAAVLVLVTLTLGVGMALGAYLAQRASNTEYWMDRYLAESKQRWALQQADEKRQERYAKARATRARNLARKAEARRLKALYAERLLWPEEGVPEEV